MHEHNTGEYLNNDQHKDTTNPENNIVLTIEDDDMESYVPETESTPETVLESTEVDEWIKSAKIDPTAEIQKPPVVLKIGEADVCYLGDFSCITGKAKSKKTFLVSMFISSFLKGSNYNISGIKHDNKKRIVWFDTEQSKYHTVKAFRRALRLSENESLHDIDVYGLRPHTPEERVKIIQRVLIDLNAEKDISFVVIDGIRDLITDINDPKQATEITTWLMKITELADLHICTVLHQNKGDKNARGHLGTEIVNKAQSVLSVEKKDENISVVSAECLRDKEFEPFAFSINEDGLPYVLADYEISKQESKKKIDPFDVAENIHREIFEAIFSRSKEYKRSDLISNIKLEYQRYMVNFGDNKAIDFLNHALNLKIIQHNGGNTKNVRYFLHK